MIELTYWNGESSEFQQIELALVFNIKEAFFIQSAVLFDIKRKTTTKKSFVLMMC